MSAWNTFTTGFMATFTASTAKASPEASEPIGGGTSPLPFADESYETASPSIFDTDWNTRTPWEEEDLPPGYGVLLPDEAPEGFGGGDLFEQNDNSPWDYVLSPKREAGEVAVEVGIEINRAGSDLLHTIDSLETAGDVARDTIESTTDDLGHFFFDPKKYREQELPFLMQRYDVNDVAEATAEFEGDWKGGVQLMHLGRDLSNLPVVRAQRLEDAGLSPDAQTTYRMEIRSYAPFEEFGDYLPIVPSFEGDARGPSEEQGASSRILLEFEMDPLAGVADPGIDSDRSELFEKDSPLMSRALDLGRDLGLIQDQATARPGGVIADQPGADGSLGVGVRLWGSNPLITGSPRINANTMFRVKLAERRLEIDGFQFGDAFPNSDIVLTDPSGNTILLHSFETPVSGELGPAAFLPGSADREMGEFGWLIPLEENGLFVSRAGDETDDD